jgi:hypothetical protein
MRCLVSYERKYNDCSFCHKLPQQVEISDNRFEDNQAGIAFYEEHNRERAS